MISESAPAAVLRRVATLLYAVMHERRRTLLRPTDAPTVRAGSGETLRFLLVGNGLVHGWGVASHQLAPTGELARGIRTLTGLACEVEFVGDAAMNVAAAEDWLGGRADGSFHGAVIAIGSNDALRLTPSTAWAARLAALVDAVQRGLPVGAPVILVGIPDVFVTARIRPLHRIVRGHARRLDRLSEDLAAARADVHFLASAPLAGLAGAGIEQAGDVYARFTTPIAVALAEAWRRSAAQVQERAGGERFDRPDVRAAVEAARWDELPALSDIVGRARARFKVSESAITLLDGDRTWHVASNGAMPVSMPKRLSYCETVVATDEPLLVPDARRDPRFAGNAFLDLVHAPFYAGVPLHGADGAPIGALCVVHGFARSADSVDLAALQELAREAEAVLQATAAGAELEREQLEA